MSAAGRAVLGRIYDRALGGMTIPAPEPDSHARESVGGDAAAVGGAGGDAAAAGRGGLRLVAPRRDDQGAVAAAAAAPSAGRPGPSSAARERARRLRLAPPVQLELVSDRQGPGAEVVWASLPERSREQVLVLLVRLIDSGAVEEDEA